MKRKAAVAVLLLLCVGSPTQALREGTASFRSNKEFAKVYLDGTYVGDTPLDLDFPCGQVSDRRYRIEYPGCAPVAGILNARVAPGRIVGAAFSFGISLIFMCPRYFEAVRVRLECAGDAVEQSEPVPVDQLPPPVDLRKSPAQPARPDSDAEILSRLRTLKDLRERGILNEQEYQQERARLLRMLGY